MKCPPLQPARTSSAPTLEYFFAVKKFWVFCFLVLSSFLLAQVGKSSKPLPASAFKLISVKVTGSSRYSSEEIVGASGLQIGQIVHEQDFKKASSRLGETGAFSDVAYAFQFSSQGTKLDLQVADSTKFVPARFDNLPWWSDSDLTSQLHARVPLFKGELPEAGTLPDQLSDALQALVVEKNTQCHVDYLRSAAFNQAIDAFVYSVSGLTMRVGQVEFRGTSPVESAALQKAAAKLQNQNYSRAALRVQAERDLLPVYLERGFLKAVFSEPNPRIAQQDSNEVLVNISFDVNPGPQYKCAGVKFAGRNIFPSAQLSQLIQQRAGEPANDVRLHEDMQAIKKLYGTRGYMAATALPIPTFDEANRTVSYLVEVVEGDEYKMGDLDIRGLDSRTSARLVEAWKIRGGEPFDASYVQKFIDQTLELLPAGQWNIVRHVTLDDSGKTVDVTIRYDPKDR